MLAAIPEICFSLTTSTGALPPQVVPGGRVAGKAVRVVKDVAMGTVDKPVRSLRAVSQLDGRGRP
jgi:hypothetical protein